MGIGPSSDETYKDYGCFECSCASFYYDRWESMGNETQRDCSNKEARENSYEDHKHDWKGNTKCKYQIIGKPDWSKYEQPGQPKGKY